MSRPKQANDFHFPPSLSEGFDNSFSSISFPVRRSRNWILRMENYSLKITGISLLLLGSQTLDSLSATKQQGLLMKSAMRQQISFRALRSLKFFCTPKLFYAALSELAKAHRLAYWNSWLQRYFQLDKGRLFVISNSLLYICTDITSWKHETNWREVIFSVIE